MAMTRLSWMLAVLFVVDLNFAFGDIAPAARFRRTMHPCQAAKGWAGVSGLSLVVWVAKIASN